MINDVIIRKKHRRRKKRGISDLDFRTRRLKVGGSASRQAVEEVSRLALRTAAFGPQGVAPSRGAPTDASATCSGSEAS
jgi:hypothetical protein